MRRIPLVLVGLLLYFMVTAAACGDHPVVRSVNVIAACENGVNRWHGAISIVSSGTASASDAHVKWDPAKDGAFHGAQRVVVVVTVDYAPTWSEVHEFVVGSKC